MPRPPKNNDEKRPATPGPRYSAMEARTPLSMDAYYALRTGQPLGLPFQPFPKLWQAFSHDPEALAFLNSGLGFDQLFWASKMLATRGPSAARDILVTNLTAEPGSYESDDPDTPKPWHDKQELAKSSKRIAAYMASDKYLFK